MFATLAGGYPFGPLPGATRSFAAAHAGWTEGDLDPATFAEAADRHVRDIAAEQVASGLDLVEDGWARVPGHGLDGVVEALLAGSLDPAGLADAWRRLSSSTTAATKAVVPGPWTLADRARRRARSEGAGMPTGGGPGRIEAEAGTIVAACVAALASAGCPMVMLAEPALARVGDAGAAWAAVAAVLEPVLRTGVGATHLCLAITGGVPAPAGLEVLVSLPFASHLVDVTAGPDAWRYLAAIPGSRGVMMGAVDARSSDLDDPEMLVWAATLAAELADRGPDRVGLAPSGSLAAIDRHHARRKAERMGEAVRLSRMGPLGAVARALQPDPGTCRIPSLRRLIADHDAVLPPIT